MRHFRIIIILILAVNCWAQQREEKDKKKSFSGYPYAFYSDETSFGIGGFAFYVFNKKKDQATSPDRLMFNSLYSFKKQFLLVTQPEFNFKRDKYKIEIPLNLKKWPSEFYGIGKNPGTENLEEYTAQIIELETLAQVNFYKQWHLGLNLSYWHNIILESGEGGQLDNKTVPGAEKFQVFGFGPVLRRDSRDNDLLSKNGSFLELKSSFYEKFWGDYDFQKYEVDLRKFVSVTEDNFIGFQGLFTYINGIAPFQKLPDMGNKMRGFKNAHFVDNHMFVSKLEFRTYPLNGKTLSRFGGVLFTEIGQVASEINDFQLNKTEISYGWGIRYLLIPDQGLTLRFDMGFSKDGVEITFSGLEEF